MDRVRAAWAAMLGVERLEPLQVLVDPTSAFAPEGWASLVRIDDAVTATVPDAAMLPQVRDALTGLSATEAVDLEVLRARLPHVDVLGPSSLFYLPGPTALPAPGVDLVDRDAIAALVAATPADDLDESGVDHVTAGLSVVRDDGGAPIAACGWVRWPSDIGHLCVLTHPDHRGRGHATRVGLHAAGRAEAEGLLPQWRARVDASKAVARAIGFEERGVQLRLLLAGT